MGLISKSLSLKMNASCFLDSCQIYESFRNVDFIPTHVYFIKWQSPLNSYSCSQHGWFPSWCPQTKSHRKPKTSLWQQNFETGPPKSYIKTVDVSISFLLFKWLVYFHLWIPFWLLFFSLTFQMIYKQICLHGIWEMSPIKCLHQRFLTKICLLSVQLPKGSTTATTLDNITEFLDK